MPEKRSNTTTFTLSPLGDSAVVITFGSGINHVIHQKIKIGMELLEKDPFDGFIECVPAYTNLTVFYDPLVIYQKQNNHHKETISPYEIVC